MYFDLFIDSFIAALVFPPRGEFLLPVMLSFPKFQIHYIFLSAFLGSIAGHCSNLLVGMIILKIAQREPWFDKKLKENLERYKRLYKRYFIWSLLFSPFAYFGGIFSLGAGLFGARFIKAVSIMIVAKALYYIILF